MFLLVKCLSTIQLVFCAVFNIGGYHSPLEKYSDQWNSEYFAKANTAADAPYLNADEKLAVHVLNLARLSPRLFAGTVLDPLTRNGYSPELSSLINIMNGIYTLKIIYPSEEIYQLAKTQSLLDAEGGKAAIEKNMSLIKNKQGFINGCLFYGNTSDAVQLIINLLLDVNNDSKSNRNFCLGDFKYLGISMQPVKNEGYYSVIRFGNTIAEKKSAPQTSIGSIYNQVKKYPTLRGGEISFWGDSTSYGSTARGLGQEIYKDKDTKILEQLVIPWLMYYTNRYRTEHGLDTLQYDQCLLKAAGYQTEYLFNESKKDHQFKLGHYQDTGSQWFTGKSPSDRALAAGCEKYCGENALYNHLLPVPADDFYNRKKLNAAAQKIGRDMVYVQLHNSKAHRENMLKDGYNSLGVSVVVGKHYPDDSYSNDKGEKIIIKDSNAVGWIAFGIQLMAY